MEYCESHDIDSKTTEDVLWLWRHMRNDNLDNINRSDSTCTHVAFYVPADPRHHILLAKSKLSSFEDFTSFREYVETELAIKAIQ